MLLGSLSRHNKDLEWWTLKPPQRVTALGSWTDHVIALRSRTDHVIAVRRICVTAQCYSSILFRRWQENPSSKKRRGWRSVPLRVRTWERERDRECLAPSFICFLPPRPALWKLGSARSAHLPEVFILVLGPFFDLPLFYFRGLSPSLSFQFSSVQSLSRVWLFATPWIATRQASLSITNSQSSPKPTSIESVMPSSHLILCRPLFLLPQSLPATKIKETGYRM